MLSPRQELVLGKVVDGYLQAGAPVGSKLIAADPEIEFGSSTIRNELALLEEHGLLAHPHTSAGRVPTDAGYRYFVDRLVTAREMALPLTLIRREIDEAMRVTSETLSQVTDLLAIVTAPPLETTTIRHVEVLLLQPQVLMVVVISSTGGVTKRVFGFDSPVDPGLADWAGAYLNEELVGAGLGSRRLAKRLADPELGSSERAFLAELAPAFTELDELAAGSLYVDGASRLMAEHRFADLTQINELMGMLERRVTLLGVLATVLAEPDVLVRIGAENELPELQGLAVVAASYGTAQRRLGAVSLLGPVRMDYGVAISAVRAASRELSRFVEDVYAS